MNKNNRSDRVPYRNGPIRFFLLFLLAMVVFGNQYAFNNPQALQDSIEKDLDIGEAQYDLLYTIFALPNIFATFVIGFLIDFLGVRFGLITLSLGVAIFQTVIAFGGAYHSYVTMLIGRMLFGIASESLITAQASFVSIWFQGKELAFALGLAITIPELGNALNSYLSPTIYEKYENLGSPLFVSVGICAVSVLCAILAAYLDKKAD